MNNTKKFALILFLGFVCILNAQETKSQKAEVFDLGKGVKLAMVLILSLIHISEPTRQVR
jgi:hypothetical protein